MTTTPQYTSLPPVPAKHADFLAYLNDHPQDPLGDLLKPYNEYDAVLRRIFAQEPEHPAGAENVLNLVPLFDANGSTDVRIRARNLAAESDEAKSKYLLPLKDEARKPNGSLATVSSIRQFQTNFNLFSENSLSDLDWSNVVAAGSAVTTSLLPVPEDLADSKRGLRQFYHEKFAPASDVDLFLYGLTEEQAIEKIKQIERCIKDSILTETSTIRTKHAITIVSQYPTRHVQIVLRLYKSISEVLTGFDVDCACAAYDGRQVYLAPRAVSAYITQANQIDLSRRSPSYENRLSKYSHRGFEVFWPDLDRSRVDPTIFERSFARVTGLARLLVLERLPKSSDREAYLDQRRQERGRPPNTTYRHSRKLHGNIKNDWDDEVAEWLEEDPVSDYHTFTIPYGENYHARRIEKLLYTKDLLLNAEWNKPKDREVHLHRHPAFFGNAEDIIHDCCGCCPKPGTPEEQEVADEESKIYVAGEISFLKDNPGRQEIGSFNPITETDWTEMAYLGNTAGLCQAIVDQDLEAVQHWLEQQVDVNRRDHTGRTPLHLAAMVSTPEIVQLLVNSGARMIARIADGRTALHIAAARGNLEIVRILLTKSEENKAEEARKEEARRKALQNKKHEEGTLVEEDDRELVSNPSDNEGAENCSYVTGSFVEVKQGAELSGEAPGILGDSNEHDPDVYDINALAWDSHASPLHLAILHGHLEVVEELVTSFGADLLLPIKLLNDHDNSPRAAILTLVLALRLPREKAAFMTAKLLDLGASPAQADLEHRTALYYLSHSTYHDILDIYMDKDKPAVQRAFDYLAVTGSHYHCGADSPLTVAISKRDPVMVLRLLEAGVKPVISFDNFIECAQQLQSLEHNTAGQNEEMFHNSVGQPLIRAIENDLPLTAIDLLSWGADPNTLTPDGHTVLSSSGDGTGGSSALDWVREKLDILRSYQGEQIKLTAPKPLEPDSFYLKEFQEGTYKHWTAKELLANRRENFDRDQKNYEWNLATAGNRKGLEEKKAAIELLLHEFQKLEAELLDRGAKTFREMYPDISIPREPTESNRNRCNPIEIASTPFEIVFGFKKYDLTAEKTENYLQLFEAAWMGDTEKIKHMTCGMWGISQERPPLEIGVAILVVRGHLDTAAAILAISMAQYQPTEEEKNIRYRIQTHDADEDPYYSDMDIDTDTNSIGLESHTIDSQFTIDNIGEIRTKVESKISPKTVLAGECNISVFLEPEKRPEKGLQSLIDYAIWKDDLNLLSFLLQRGQNLASEYYDMSGSSLYTVPKTSLLMAMRLGRLRCLEELIKRTGAGLPLDKLAEQSGVEIKEKPKYYQGLSVYGQKRADWAAQGGGIRATRAINMPPPLLRAAREGNLEAVEWFLGTAPSRHYLEFAKANKRDKRLKRLALADGGVEKSINDWLDSRRDLVLHCAILSPINEDSERFIKYLVQNMPHCLEVKSQDGYTPLAVAFRHHNLEAAEILIEAGANQAVRDKEGKNIIHNLLFNMWSPDQEILKKARDMMNLIDRRLVPSMLTERCSLGSGSLTPLSFWMSRAMICYSNYSATKKDSLMSVLNMILDLAEGTGQKHLEALDGAGNTVVHDAVRRRQVDVVKALLAHRPDLVHKENATGFTPAELAEAAWISEVTSSPPNVPKSTASSSYYRRRTLDAGIVNEAPEKFTKNAQRLVDSRRNSERTMYEVCLEKDVEITGAKRKLVTLLDANEVAKRLASKSIAFKRRRYNDDDDNPTDEVGEWLS
ncbi:hypothetical protein ARAM_004358 [Aspergillus rambellii]|uniref:Ankyrin repeat protein n=1 Tax=Aspergillus rambellii TaxID=308745 RepID=A0A0F8XTU6_9EURO|nr:hypothetical protein ARAM_004358 [Aspergillus rambellii]